jgi:ribonuclease P protein subunit RPR2
LLWQPYYVHEGLEKRMDANTKRVALQRIRTLFRLASETIHEDPALAQRYAGLARRIAMAARVRLPRECRLQICRHCKSFILPSANCRVRLEQRREPHMVITCLNCGEQMRRPIRRRKMGDEPRHE